MHGYRRIYCAALAVLPALTFASDLFEPPAAAGLRVDVFTIDSSQIEGAMQFLENYPAATLRVHTLDAIEQLERELSSELPADPDVAKRVAVQRLSELPESAAERLQDAALALAKAVELGVLQYPAIVFDQAYVVYGSRALPSATRVYLAWRQEQGR